MDKRNLIWGTGLLALGAAIGFYWRQLERAPAAKPVEATAEQSRAANPAPSGPPATNGQLAAKVRASLGPEPARPATPAADDAEWQQELAAARAELMAEYPDLGMDLQLTDEEAGRFLDLLARQQVEVARLIAARPHSVRNGVYSQSLLRDITTLEVSDIAEQAALLQGKYPEWQQLQENRLQRNPIDLLQNRLVQQGVGVSDEQIDALNTALAAAQDRIGWGQQRPAAPPGQGLRPLLEQEVQYAAYRRELVAVASRYLSGRQLEIYEQLLNQRLRNAQRLLRTMDAADWE